MELQAFLQAIETSGCPDTLVEGLKTRAKGLWWYFKPTPTLLKALTGLFVERVLKQGKKFAIYPASQLVKGVLELIPKSEYEPLLNSFVDTNHHEDRFSDFPKAVVGPKTLSELDIEFVLIFHPFAEDAIAHTIETIVPGLKVLKFFTGPIFESFMIQETGKKVESALWSREGSVFGEEHADDALKVVMINSYGPSIVLPEFIESCQNPSFDVVYIHSAELGHFKNREVAHIPCGDCLWECAEVIQAVNPDMIYVQDNSLYNYQKAPILRAGFPHIPFIYEPYDLISALYTDPMHLVADGRRHEDIQFGLDVESFLLTESDGVVHMDNGPEIDAIMEQTDSNHLEFHAYLPLRLFQHVDRGCGDPIHLVWAGGIAPDSAPDETRGENKLLSFFQSLIGQGFRVTAFNSLAKDQVQLERDYPTYLQFAKDESHFKIQPFVPRDQLIEILAQNADYGMHLYPKPKDDEARGNMYHSSMAGKVFTYLSAGIPILTCDFLEPISRYVKAHKVGISIGEQDFGRIGEILHQADYPELKKRVKDIIPTISFEGNLSRLESFFVAALRRAKARGASLTDRAIDWLERYENGYQRQ